MDSLNNKTFDSPVGRMAPIAKEKDSEEVQPISATSSGNHFKRFHGAECLQADEMRPFMHHLLHLTGKNCRVLKNTSTSSLLSSKQLQGYQLQHSELQMLSESSITWKPLSLCTHWAWNHYGLALLPQPAGDRGTSNSFYGKGNTNSTFAGF